MQSIELKKFTFWIKNVFFSDMNPNLSVAPLQNKENTSSLELYQ